MMTTPRDMLSVIEDAPTRRMQLSKGRGRRTVPVVAYRGHEYERTVLVGLFRTLRQTKIREIDVTSVAGRIRIAFPRAEYTVIPIDQRASKL